MMTLTQGTWCYSHDLSSIVCVQNNQVKLLADFGKVFLPDTDNNAIVMCHAKEMHTLLEEMALKGACSETLQKARELIEDMRKQSRAAILMRGTS